MTEKSGQLTITEAIELLKDYRKGDFVDDYKLCEAIDTVVAELEKIGQLIEDYQRRLATLKHMKGLDMIADTRLRTKESCYRTFISELEKIRKDGNNE